jgi:hypothetical protein
VPCLLFGEAYLLATGEGNHNHANGHIFNVHSTHVLDSKDEIRVAQEKEDHGKASQRWNIVLVDEANSLYLIEHVQSGKFWTQSVCGT